VVIHELCHLKYPNHKREFWALVEKTLSDYKVSRVWLRQNAFKLDFLAEKSELYGENS